MAKRRRQDSDEQYYEDDPIGLTGAFEVIRDPQAVEYDKGDEAIGLTEAFGAVRGDEELEHGWDKAGKWTDFDWDAPMVERFGPDEPIGEAPGVEGQDELPENPGDAPLPEAVPDAAAESDAAGAAAPNAGTAAQPQPAAPAGRGAHGRHAAPIPELSPRMKRSKRLRKTLVLIIILLVAVLGVLVYFGFHAFDDSQHEAAQQAQEQTAAPKEEIASEGQGDADSAAQRTEVPELTSLFGMSTKKAVKAIGHGAIVTSSQKSKEKGSAIKKEVSIALTEEPADSKTGTPTVYLGLDKGGKVIQIGYSASASALGFGSFSFADAINEKHVVEETFKLMGVEIPDGAVKLPKDKKKYSTYGSDGSTVVKERYAFDGDVDVNGAPCTWSAVLSYDYTTQVLTGNLSDTVRIIYAYLTKK